MKSYTQKLMKDLNYSIDIVFGSNQVNKSHLPFNFK